MNVICGNCSKPLIRRGKPRLHYFCNFNCKAEWQRTQKPVDRDWLYQKYIIEQLDCTSIAKLVNRNSKRVWEWLRDYGIPTRHRGGSTAPGSFPKGTQSMIGKKHTDETRAKLRAARLRDGHFPKQANGEPYWKGKGGEQHPNWQGGITPERQSDYAKQEWHHAVKVVWVRDNAICQRCGLDHRNVNRELVSFVVHHIIGYKNKTLRFNPDNLVLLCVSCHRFVHSNANTEKEWIGNGD